jgi:hypothetical protein
MGWNSKEEPGAWKPIVRTFKDGHTEEWWAVEVTTLINYGPDETVRLVAVSADPETLPANSTWYLATNLPVPGYGQAKESPFEEADLAEVVRLYGLRQWVEQSYRQIKGELGFSDFQVRKDHAIRRHWELVLCAFSFCWWAYTREHSTMFMDPTPQTQPVAEQAGEKRRGLRRATTGESSSVMAGSPAAGEELAGPVGYAVALLESVVESAPATTTASAA